GPLRSALERYSSNAITFLARIFPRYAPAWRIDYASFRPFEEEGRPLSPKARNELGHVDSFQSRPTEGDRILRFFTNVHREEARREPFSFPPGSSWIAYTDMVSHGVLSGQSAMEQTMIISKSTMSLPEKAPIAILERLSGQLLA